MALNQTVVAQQGQIKGTLADINAAAAANLLVVGRAYLTTDQTTNAYGIAVSTSSIVWLGGSSSSSASTRTVTTVGGATFEYEIVSGTPTISYTKNTGVAIVSISGGTLKLRRFADTITPDVLDTNASFKFQIAGSGTNANFARPHAFKFQLNVADASADASSNSSTSNQIDVDNTPKISYGNFVYTGNGQIIVRVDNIDRGLAGLGIDLIW